jgi:hypothetical protein
MPAASSELMIFDVAFDYVRILSMVLQEGHRPKPAFQTPFVLFWQTRISTALPLPKDTHKQHMHCVD